MKTILQAIKDEIYYPINDGLVENKLLGRDLVPDGEFSKTVLNSDAWKGAAQEARYNSVQLNAPPRQTTAESLRNLRCATAISRT